MPTFKDFTGFNGALTKMEKDVALEARTKIALTMGKKAQAIAEAAASADLGGDPKFSGWAPKLETQLKVVATGVLMTPTKSGAGPWTVAQFGRHQGNGSGFSGPGISVKTGKTSRTKSGGLRKVRARGTTRWNGTTKGKNTADKALLKIDVELPKMAEIGVKLIVAKHFDLG